jgi:hypothetical protein
MLRVTRGAVVEGRCPLYKEEENDMLVFIKFKDATRWREQFLIISGFT